MSSSRRAISLLRQSLSPLQPAVRTTRTPAANPRRNFFLSRQSRDYPKEGVFQSNSPPRPQPPPPQYGAPLPPPPPPRSTGSGWRPSWVTLLAVSINVWFGYAMITAVLGRFESDFSVPDEQQDAADLKAMWENFDQIELVKELRNSWRTEDGRQVPVWKEHTAYQSFEEAERGPRLTTGPLAGSHGVAAQRIFVSGSLEEHNLMMLHFVCFGRGTVGWPGVVHGGALGTILDESLGRCAARHLDARTGVTANLELNYVDKCTPGEWYVIILGLDEAHEADQTGRKKYVTGVMACCGESGPQYDGEGFANVHPHVVAKALFVAPKNIKLIAPIEEQF